MKNVAWGLHLPQRRQQLEKLTGVPLDIWLVDGVLRHALQEEFEDGCCILLPMLAQHMQRILAPAVKNVSKEVAHCATTVAQVAQGIPWRLVSHELRSTVFNNVKYPIGDAVSGGCADAVSRVCAGFALGRNILLGVGEQISLCSRANGCFAPPHKLPKLMGRSHCWRLY